MKKILFGALASIALLGAGAADATVVTTATQTINFGGTTDFAQPGSFQLFDSSLGTLTSINIQINYGFNSTLTVSNTAATSSKGSAFTDSALSIVADDANQNAVFTSLLGTPAANGNAASPATLDVQGGTVRYTLAPHTSTSAASNAATTSTGFATDTITSDLAYFAMTGGGIANLTGSTFTQTFQGNTGGNSSSSQVTTGTGSFQIYYTYDNSSVAAVPEPASWVMMIGGFGLVGFGLRRKGTQFAFNR